MPARASSRRRDRGALTLTAAGSAVLDALLPRACLLCGRPCQAGRHTGGVCDICRLQLIPIRPPVCERCGIELVSERRVCTRCRELEYPFVRNVAVYAYRGELRELVHLYKIAGKRSLALLFAEVLGEAYRREYPGIPLVPVPGRKAVWRRRGWEHVDLLARTLERRHGIVVARCLARRSGGAQKVLDRAGRLANIRAGFVPLPGRAVPAEAVLLDDIFTTGATLGTCAAVLRAGGCGAVYGLTLAVDE